MQLLGAKVRPDSTNIKLLVANCSKLKLVQEVAWPLSKLKLGMRVYPLSWVGMAESTVFELFDYYVYKVDDIIEKVRLPTL